MRTVYDADLLLVDDNPDLLRLLSDQLSGAGYRPYPNRRKLRRRADRLFGLGLGADDYLTKPFLMQELLLRVQHILQRAYRTELSRTRPSALRLGDRQADLNDATVTLSTGKTLSLTATERALLEKLAENRGHIVTYDALCAAVWGADYAGYENSLGVHIRHLREKIEAEPSRPRWLLTARGIGYKLAGEESR